ncbi:MAG: ABC transporter permease [Promethearchaeota archaeon]
MNKNNLLTIWILAKKNIKLYFKKGPVIIFGFLFPLFLMLSWVIGRNMEPGMIFIGLSAMTIFFTATSISPVVLPIETQEKSLERQLSSPIRIFDIIMGIILASTMFSSLMSLGVLVIVYFALQLSALTFLEILIFIICLCFMALIGSLLGTLFSAIPTNKTSDVMVLINLIKFPMTFISGIFVSLQTMSVGAQLFAYVSPLTPFVDILHNLFGLNSTLSIGINILILLGWMILLAGLNQMFHQRTMTKRFSGKSKKQKSKKPNK